MSKLKILVLLALVIAVSPLFNQSVVRAADEYTVGLGKSAELGTFLVGKGGMTLYLYSVDPLNDSVCVDKCAQNWPPLLVDSADKITADEDIPGKFSTITRKDGTLQVAYNGIALYYWAKDKAAGDTTGNRVGRVWWVVPPATAYSSRNAKLGNILVGANGMTLYTYSKDTADTSNCNDKCAEAWPPVTVKSADAIVPGLYLPGKFATITRADKTLQVTYNGHPLYFFAKDQALGDATGEGVGGVWATVVPETVAAANNKDLGDLLTTPDGMTLYTFKNDKEGVSNCSGDCAKAWPPYIISPINPRVAGPASLTGKLGTITRDDKSVQVTYNGLPLYLYAKDKVPGDATGNKVGDAWFVVKP